jgi:hypothetical protein
MATAVICATAQAQSAPAAPTGLTATALSGSQIRLTWADNSGNETGFGIWRKTSAGDWVRDAVAPANATSIIMGNLAIVTTYDYRIRAHNGSGVSAWSNEARATTLNPPGPPSNLMAGALSGSEISLTWFDNSLNETGFGIWRKINGGEWARIAAAPANSNTFVDRSPSPNTTYTYRVRAHNTESVSDWSNEATTISEAVVSVSHSAPTEISATDFTRILVQFSVPVGYRLVGSPSVTVNGPGGVNSSVTAAEITQTEPIGKAYRDWMTPTFPTGTYQVRAEVTYERPGGGSNTAVSAWSAIAVPPARLSSVNLPGVVIAGETLVATLRLTRPPVGDGGVVTLSSSNPGVVQVPTSVTVPNWTYWSTARVTTSAVTTTTPVTITATYAGVTRSIVLSVAAVRRIAVFRPSTGEWLIREVDGTETKVRFGSSTDRPVPADYLGTGHAQMAVFRPSTQEWFVRDDQGVIHRTQWGATGDEPVPGDYLGWGRAQITIYRPSTGQWGIRNLDGTPTIIQHGGPGDLPLPADYLGVGRTQAAVYRPSRFQWLLRGEDGSVLPLPWGSLNEQPVPADYLGLGHVQVAGFHSMVHTWAVRKDEGDVWAVPALDPGVGTQVAVPGDYLGLGRAQPAVYIPSTTEWIIWFNDQAVVRLRWGSPEDVPVPANYSGR